MSEANPRQVFTVPNLISALRLLGVPLFFWAITTERFGTALLLVIVAGISDWADGQLARRLDQYSDLGEKLDPIADRLYIAATLLGLAITSIVPWWFVALVVARDVVMAGYLVWLRGKGILGVPVHYVGKGATMLLLYAFPVLLLGQVFPGIEPVARAAGWAFALWGLGMYWYAAWLYWGQRGEVRS